MRKPNHTDDPGSSYRSRVVATGLALAVVLGVVRTKLLFGWADLRAPLDLATRAGLGAYYDLAYVTALTVAFLLGLLLVRRSHLGSRLLWALYLGAALLSVVLALVNVPAIEVLGRPINYQWLYYSHFLRSLDATNAIRALLSWKRMLAGVAIAAAMLGLAGLIAFGLRLLRGRPVARSVRIVGAGGVCLYFGVASLWIHQAPWQRGKLENPVVAFARSILTADRNPTLMGMTTSIGPEDFLPAGERLASPADTLAPLARRARAAGVRNVLVVALESVPAEYVGAFGSPYRATPMIDSYRGRAMSFTNFYAHVPSTDHSLVSLLLSVYPPVSYRTLTLEYPGIRLASLSSELKRRGYRTGFFTTSDNRFQRMDDFLASRQFDTIADYRTLACAKRVFPGSSGGWRFLDGTEDACGAAALGEWLARAPNRPFFAMLWTMQTHFPYFVAGKERQAGVPDSLLRRYLGALGESDRAVGQLLRGLETRRLLDSTLVVIVGDHGQAFGRHGTYAHGSSVYEESVHVPLLLINPRLFHGELSGIVGGMNDLAPTVQQLLGHPPAPTWQGRSLFDPERSGRVYFFEPFSTFVFGYREHARKFIFNGTSAAAELYDLRNDPHEFRNLARRKPEEVREGLERLAAWVQFQNRFLGRFLVDEAR